MSEQTGKAHGPDHNGPTKKRLNRAAWHKPLVSIIVTHHNYSHMVEDALLSILDQTHENWECVIVDDASEAEHRHRLEAIVREINHPKIHILALKQNKGQTMAFFAGLEETVGEFVTMLDPDDRYSEQFLQEALNAHLNGDVICPIMSTDQHYVRDNQTISRTVLLKPEISFAKSGPDHYAIGEEGSDLYFYPHYVNGWIWATTSSMMYRRPALEKIKPTQDVKYKYGADAYVALGCHFLGGTIFLNRPLVYRTLHNNNAFATSNVYSLETSIKRPDVKCVNAEALTDVKKALKASGIQPLALPREAGRPLERLRDKWQNSFRKRWNRFTGRGRNAT